MSSTIRFEQLRSRILLALGLSGAVLPAAACGTTTPHPDAHVAADAAKTDAPGPDAPITIRRPFLVGASLRSSAAIARRDWAATVAPADDDASLDADTRAALAAVWLQDALEEHASVAAFSRFAMQLLSVGAPPELVADAQRAAVDEIRHARAAFGLAQRYSGRALGPAPLRVDDAMHGRSLAELAELTAEEGCVGETLGALLAAEQARLAIDPTAQRILRSLARDEMRHAELAWRFARWAVEVGGDDVRIAIERGVQRAAAGTLAAPRRAYAVDLDRWHAHGRVTCDEARAVAVVGLREIVEPAVRALRDRRSATGAIVESSRHIVS